jgi:SAM-dependent methyltransferase
MMPKFLNLGCGARFCTAPDWINIDFQSFSPNVKQYDLKQGIPFADDSVDAVYHSHVLEHFPTPEAVRFLAECRRVLKPGGIVRVVVPDLESIAKAYLQALDKAAGGEESWQQNYEWLMIELYDQAVRDTPGGEMGSYLRAEKIPNLDFVLERGGIEVLDIMKAARQEAQAEGGAGRSGLRRMLGRLYWGLRRAGFGREALVHLLLGRDYDALRMGRFRRSGEPHLWMYDRYSLPRTLRRAGFQNPQLLNPTDSQIPNWVEFNLDTEPDGTVYKPHSLYAEALK